MTITQNQTNNLLFFVAPTLTYLLVRLVNKVTCKEFAFIVTDSATNCDFVVAQMTEPGNGGADDAINGTIKIDSGSYDLHLYEQSSSTNLDYTLSSSLLDSYDMYVYSDENCARNHI